jgi:hypothetical protein
MSGGSPARVIPRPSERRVGAVRRRGLDSPLDLRDGRGSRADAHVPANGNPSEGSESSVRATALTIAAVSSLAAALAFGTLGLLGRQDTTWGLVLAPLFTFLASMAIHRWVKPFVGETTAAIILAGFGVRMLGAVPRLMGGADSTAYQREGERIARSLRVLDFGVETGRSIPGTGSVRYFSGLVNVLTGSSYIATFLVFTAIAFVGQVFLLFGVRRALNQKQFRVFAVIVMFSPTLAYWPSSIGKESLVLFGIGLGVFGASRLYDRRWNGLLPVLFGVFSVGIVRPHVAMVLLAGLLAGLFARQAHTRGRAATHGLLLVLIIVGSMLTAGASADLFGLESFDGVSDVNAALDFAQDRTSQDQAQFVAARVTSPVDYPWAVVTVLFRPFLWETTNTAAMISAAESTLLGLLLLAAAPGLARHVRDLFQRGQLLFSCAFIAVFIFVFSAIGNFGILSRQRAQVIPFVLLLVAMGIGAEKRELRKASR